MVRINLLRIGILLTPVFIGGCKGTNPSTLPAIQDSLVVNCYIIKPIRNDSKADTIRDFDFSSASMDDFLIGIISGKRPIVYDSAMDNITNFERQRIILVNYKCFGKLNQPDSCGLDNLYFNTGSATWIKKRPVVTFLRTYKKDIMNFGKADIFEYRFNNVAEAEPHFMYIILRERTEDDEHYNRDYKGIVLCSDGLDWQDYPDKDFSIPLFTQMVRRSKEFYIPLHYDGDRFIPIGHFKSNNWQE
jgi:hypothetical protein